MGDALRQILGPVADVEQLGGTAAHDAVQDLQQALAVVAVQAVARFVQDQQARSFNHGPGHKHQALLAEGELGHGPAGQVGQTEAIHPLARRAALGRVAEAVEPHRIEESRTDHIEGGHLALVARLQDIAQEPVPPQELAEGVLVC